MEDKTYFGYSWLDDEDNEFKICIVHFDIQLYFIFLPLMGKKLSHTFNYSNWFTVYPYYSIYSF